MCLIFVSYRETAGCALVVAANRDEFYARPTAAAGYWEDLPQIIAGRDLSAGGTWLGVTPNGRFAALTNYRSGLPRDVNAPSRGDLVKNFLAGELGALDYLRSLEARAGTYAGFSLLAFGAGELAYFSNQERAARPLEPGLYGLSNELLDTPCPKVVQGKRALGAVLARRNWSHDEVLDLMADKGMPVDGELPDTGVGLERERMLAPMMVAGDAYGTRCSTVVKITLAGTLDFVERSYQPYGADPASVAYHVERESNHGH